MMKFKLTGVALLLLIVLSTAFTPPLLKPVTYKVDLEKSTLTWSAKKVTGGHNGTVELQSGELLADGKKLTGGKFVINMATIKDADKSARLENHLKADDFFGVDKFATSTFVIKKVIAAGGNKVNVTGDLVIKGITNSITFPATVVLSSDGTLTATADKVIVDRTKFGIKFRSKGMFPDIGDKMIYDEFELSIKLIAKR